MAVADRHLDSEALYEGVHDGSTGLVLRKMHGDFLSCGVTVGLAVYNDTDGSNGLTTIITENEVTCTLAGGSLNTWTKGDEFSIYKTATKDSLISTTYCDKRRGKKVTRRIELTKNQLFPEDVDLDEDGRDIFGPGFPESVRRGY